ncbi:vomeronasal type-2 receptor 26-like [Gastrophryne carolinensis]
MGSSSTLKRMGDREQPWCMPQIKDNLGRKLLVYAVLGDYHRNVLLWKENLLRTPGAPEDSDHGKFSLQKIQLAWKSLAEKSELCCPNVKDYAEILTIIFTVEAINDHPDLLPNITLGYIINDSCGDVTHAVYNILKMPSRNIVYSPNYACGKQGEVIGFINNDVELVHLLRIYGYPQITYDSNLHSNLLKTLSITGQDDHLRLEAIVFCLKTFGWNWVGIITPHDGSADKEFQELSREMAKNGICIAYVVTMTKDLKTNQQKLNVIQKSTASVIIMCGKASAYDKIMVGLDDHLQNITFILHDTWTVINFGRSFTKLINCSLYFQLITPDMPALEKRLHNINRHNRPGDPILEDIYYYYHACTDIDQIKLKIFQTMYVPIPEKSCANVTHPLYLLWNYSHLLNNYQLCYTMSTLARALDAVQRLGVCRKSGCRNKVWKYFESIYEHYARRYNLFNLRIDVTNNIDEYSTRHFGFFNKSSYGENYFIMNPGNLTWKIGKVPQSRCSESCPPGYRKAPINKVQACCYDCVQCSEGEVSNVTDSDICQRCPDEEWPDERKETCRPKITEYLTFNGDVLTLLFSVISVLGSVISAAVIKLFISFWDTPVVKANNRTVSIILLTSILLSFLCVFLFLGRPVHITCMLRQVSFGIFFTISVSCVLAKTIIVCIAFKTTKPGSYWNKWVGTKLANYVVLICSSVQVLICVIWLSVSHPYQEYDLSSYHEKIIIQCNEGSVIGFYTMLGYLGFLAAVSFVLAFMVRTLPDSFNEAKYITFSMLVFCSVWIAMIPAYLSTRGKYMVAVEIFAILTSCAGLLGCIFFPKLYIFAIKPELNTRLYVAGK